MQNLGEMKNSPQFLHTYPRQAPLKQIFPVRPASGKAQHKKDIPRPDTTSTPPRTGWVKDPAGAAKRRGQSQASFTQTSMVAGLKTWVSPTLKRQPRLISFAVPL
jgi:hypothetical protein